MKYNVIDEDGQYWIDLAEQPYDGIMFSYGKVEFKEPEVEDEDVLLQFEYNLRDESLTDQYKNDGEFHQVIGEILLGMIEDQLANGELVYKGGK